MEQNNTQETDAVLPITDDDVVDELELMDPFREHLLDIQRDRGTINSDEI